jgi:hypothetical protein
LLLQIKFLFEIVLLQLGSFFFNLWEISPKCENVFGAATPTKGFFGKFLKRFAKKAGFLDWIARFRTSAPAGHQTAAGLHYFFPYPTCPVAKSC